MKGLRIANSPINTLSYEPWAVACETRTLYERLGVEASVRDLPPIFNYGNNHGDRVCTMCGHDILILKSVAYSIRCVDQGFEHASRSPTSRHGLGWKLYGLVRERNVFRILMCTYSCRYNGRYRSTVGSEGGTSSEGCT